MNMCQIYELATVDFGTAVKTSSTRICAVIKISFVTDFMPCAYFA